MYLQNRFLNLSWELGVGMGDAQVTFGKLKRAYEPRAYHNLTHIEECLNELDGARRLVTNLPAVELALWFHDAVYEVSRETKAGMNEERSAEFAKIEMRNWGLNEELAGIVEQHILMTKHKHIPGTIDGRIVVDIDMSILGKPWERYAEYKKGIRKEFACYDWDEFIYGRKKFLSARLTKKNVLFEDEKPQIFHTGHFYDLYEKQAQENMAREFGLLAEST
ncbi:MAG: hypothetical protein WCK90_03905 [archaeon]